MSLTNTEFETILEDTTKRIEKDIVWVEDEDHSPSVEFRAEIASENGWPLFVRGSYNPLAQALNRDRQGDYGRRNISTAPAGFHGHLDHRTGVHQSDAVRLPEAVEDGFAGANSGLIQFDVS